jgi:hypothetical protein
VAVIHNGRIAEAGSHAELYRRGGIYKELFGKQFEYPGDARETQDVRNFPSTSAGRNTENFIDHYGNAKEEHQPADV